ncbi:hypothetical protein V9T40_009356 [Parthenolecanium corni]|uniref:Uncharacterized protein n=1 Tax=Parthenolecanium corni TaxID=536013 RepID=A0AAN9TSC7_9HEMI
MINKSETVKHQYDLIATKRYDSIELHFLVSGDNYMPCDQDFAITEKRKKFVQAMVPSEIKDVIATAKLEQPFVVTDMAPEDFYDFCKVAHKLLNIIKLKITSLTAVRVTHSALRENTILTKTTYRNSEECLVVKVNKRHIKLLQHIPLNMPRITHPPILKKEKLTDLSNMIEFLEPKYRDSMCSSTRLFITEKRPHENSLMDGASGSDDTDATSTSTPIVKTGNVQNSPPNLIILKDKNSPMEAVKEGKDPAIPLLIKRRQILLRKQSHTSSAGTTGAEHPRTRVAVPRFGTLKIS